MAATPTTQPTSPNGPIPLARTLLAVTALVILSLALSVAVTYLAGATFSDAGPLTFGAAVALVTNPEPPLTTGRRHTLLRWAAGTTVLTLLLVLATNHRDSPLNLWPLAVLDATVAAALTTANSRFARAFYAALAIMAGEMLLGLVIVITQPF
jgi:hypothetical protein